MLLVFPLALMAAVGCDLNDPDKDVKRLFPESTGYVTHYKSIQKSGGKAMLGRIENRLGDKFAGLFETIDVPYTVYEILKGKERIGWIHGVNQKGQYGGIQVFLALDNKHVIKDIYFQRLTSKHASKLKDKKFISRFSGLSETDLQQYDVRNGLAKGRLATIKSPAKEIQQDFHATMRAIKKNLILMDEFFPVAAIKP